MKKIFFVLSLCLLLVSNSFAVVPYNTKARTPRHYGYYENMLQTDMYEVQFMSNDSWFHTKNFCMLRCANLCLENGYKSFNILFSETEVVQVHNFGVYMNIECFRDDSGKYKAEEIKTNLRKVGAFLGDNVEIGCGCVLNPGTIIMPNTNVYPLTSVRGVIPNNSIVKSMNSIVKKEEK